ncbi:MAG: hypothetical protein ACFE0O_00990 [Opitutales bacterium]
MIEDWSSYRVSDVIPYSAEVLTTMLAGYNERFAFIHLGWVILNAGWLTLWWFRPAWRAGLRSAAGLLLVAAWLWTGWMWHGQTLAAIQPFAPVLTALFLLQAGLVAGLWRWKPALPPTVDPSSGYTWRGVHPGLILYAISALLPVPVLWHGNLAPVTLFGWGSGATAAGTIGLVFAMHREWHRAGLLVMPLVVCSYELLTAWGLLSRAS